MATTTSTLKTEITADNKKFIAATLEARAKVKQLALAIRNEYGVAMKDAENLARKTFANTNSALASTQKQISTTSSLLGGLSKKFTAFLAVGALTSGFKNIYQDIDRTIASAEKLDIAVNKFQALEFAAKRSDVEISTLENGLKKLRSTIATSLQTGNDPFKQLNLSAKELSELDIVDAYVKLGAQVKKSNSEIAQVTAVNGIFGLKAGQEQLNAFRSDLEGAINYYKTNIGGLSEEDVLGFAKLDKQVDEVGAKIKNDLQKGIIQLTPLILDASSAFASMAKNIGKGYSVLKEFVNSARDLADSALSDNTPQADVKPGLFVNGKSFKDQLSSIPSFRDGAKTQTASFIDVPTELNKLAIAAAAATGGLDSLRKQALDLFGVNTPEANGKNYLQSILTDKSRPQAMDEGFNKIANEIRDSVLKNPDSSYLASNNASRISELKRIANTYGGRSDIDNTGQLNAIKEIEKGLKVLSTTPQKVDVAITVDKEGIIKAVVANNQFTEAVIQTAVAAADNSAREAVR